jgi:hypothetical protein
MVYTNRIYIKPKIGTYYITWLTMTPHNQSRKTENMIDVKIRG